jgi:hypothetical protein
VNSTTRGRRHLAPVFGDGRDTVVTLRAPGRPAAPHPATGTLESLMDWALIVRGYLRDGLDVAEADRIALAQIASRNHDGKGRRFRDAAAGEPEAQR